MEQKIKEITKRVYYGDINPHYHKNDYVIQEEALYRIRKHFGNELYNFILIKEGTDEYGADYMEGILKIIIPDTYKPKDFYIP